MMIGGGEGPSTSPSTAATNRSHAHTTTTNTNSNAHNLIRSILFRHTSGPSGAKTASSRQAGTSTTTSRTASSSLETSPNPPLYAAGIPSNGSSRKGIPQGGTTAALAATSTSTSAVVKASVVGGAGDPPRPRPTTRKNFPKFPSLLVGHHPGNGPHRPFHHCHHRDEGGASASNNAHKAHPPSAVRYAAPRKSGVLGRYHRTVGGLQQAAAGHHHRRAAARHRHRQQQQQEEAQAKAKEGGGAELVPAEVVRHAQIHPRPSAQAQARRQVQVQGQGQTPGQATGATNDTTPPQPHPVANLRRSSSSSAAIPIPSHHIRRTASELQLCEDELRAEYRDRVMYVRCYPAIAGATTARRRMTMQAAGHTSTSAVQHEQQHLQGPCNQEQQVPTNCGTAAIAITNQEEAGRHIDAYRRATAPPVLSHGSGGEADWLLYDDDDHPLDGPSPSSRSTGGGAEVRDEKAAALASPMPDRSANPRPSYVDEVEAEVKVKVMVEPSPSGSPIVVRNPTPPKDVGKATNGAATTATATEKGGAGGWPVACSQTRRNISILRQASETMYSTTTTTATATATTNTATTSAATTGTTTTPSSSNPASRATSRTTSREEGDFNPYCHQDDAGQGQMMILDGDGYLEGELHDYEHPGPMPPRSTAGGRAAGRKNSASSYEDVFVIDDL